MQFSALSGHSAPAGPIATAAKFVSGLAEARSAPKTSSDGRKKLAPLFPRTIGTARAWFDLR
jgi:hypothetical protein